MTFEEYKDRLSNMTREEMDRLEFLLEIDHIDATEHNRGGLKPPSVRHSDQYIAELFGITVEEHLEHQHAITASIPPNLLGPEGD